MALEALAQQNVDQLLKVVPSLLQLRRKKMWLDYDAEADVLYMHFEEKPSSDHSEMRRDGIILDYHEDRLVGLSILDASQR